MEVRKGYKQTEVGVIPQDWDVDYIGNIAQINTGGRNTQDRIEDGAYPFFVRSQTVERINSYSFDGEAVLTAGDGVGTGKVFHYINGKFDAHQRVYQITNFNGRIKGYYFFLYFSNHFYKRIMQMTAKSSVDSVRMEMIAKMLIPLPPLAEQEAIAEALSDADALIESLETLLAKKRQVKQGAMSELLSGKRRLLGYEKKKGYKQTEVGIIPEDWEVVPMGSLGTFTKGMGIKKDEALSGEIPCVRYGEIYTHHNDVVREFNSWISPEVAKTSKRLKKGDLLFAGSGETKEEIGKCVAFTWDVEAYAGGDIVILTPKTGVTEFFGYLFNAPVIVKQKASKGQGDAVVHISSSALSTIRVPFPTLTEQTAIAEILSDMDAEIRAVEEKLSKARAVKAGMMSELLGGRIRLVESGEWRVENE